MIGVMTKLMNVENSPEILHVEHSQRGRYWTNTAAGEAELTYQLGDSDAMIIAGTFVPRQARGTGVALALVKRAVADARARGRKIAPLCPYVARIFDRHKEWADLRV